MKPNRGRPADVMTMRRRQILDHLVQSREPVSLATLARRCGLYDYRHARRIKHDLERIGAI